MCHPASFIITKTKVLWSRNSDSHEEIIKEYRVTSKLNDKSDPPNFVRVEITPPNKTDLEKPLKDWVFKVDQDKTPEWFDKDEVEIAVRKVLPEWFDVKVKKTGHHEIKSGMTAYLCGNSTATLWGNSTAVLYGNSTAILYGNSTATLCGNSTAALWGNSTATLWGNSTAILYGNSTAALWENSAATLWGNSTAILYGNSTVKQILGGVAKFFCKFSVKIKGKFSVVIDMTGEQAVCHVGNDQERIVTGGKK